MLTDEECDAIARASVPRALSRVNQSDNFTEYEIRALIRAAYAAATEMAAKVAKAHRPKSIRRAFHYSDEVWAAIMNEARGEQIAAETIAAAIREGAK